MKIKKRINYLKQIINVAFFIATKSIKRGSIAAKSTMIFILMLTFLNLTVVGGLLNGIIDDIGNNVRENFVGDVFIEPAPEYDYLQNISELHPHLQSDKIEGYSKRLLASSTLQYEYQKMSANNNKKPPRAKATLAGIFPEEEKRTTEIINNIVAGDFLNDKNWNGIILGANLVENYGGGTTSSANNLGMVNIGDKVRARLQNGNTFEFVVAGIFHTKETSIDQRAFVNYETLQSLLGLPTNKYSEIAIKVNNREDAPLLLKRLKNVNGETGYESDIKDAEQAAPGAVTDLKVAFGLIANIVGLTAILVGLVIVFVIIFINASNRRSELGILKAQGIEPSALILSYVFQALFYTVAGVIIALGILFFFLQGYFQNNPISLPMADGRLLLGFDYLTLRVIVLIVSAIISGLIPAWLIIKQNTLDSILGR